VAGDAGSGQRRRDSLMVLDPRELISMLMRPT